MSHILDEHLVQGAQVLKANPNRNPPPACPGLPGPFTYSQTLRNSPAKSSARLEPFREFPNISGNSQKIQTASLGPKAPLGASGNQGKMTRGAQGPQNKTNVSSRVPGTALLASVSKFCRKFLEALARALTAKKTFVSTLASMQPIRRGTHTWLSRCSPSAIRSCAYWLGTPPPLRLCGNLPQLLKNRDGAPCWPRLWIFL